MSNDEPRHALFPRQLNAAFFAFLGLFVAVDLACGGWRDLLSYRWLGYAWAAYVLQIFAAVRDQPVFWERGAKRGRMKIARQAASAPVAPGISEPAPRGE
ncbi:MAG TPA: hypothetical protein VFH27_02790 [Longimicrobiaceae bacterium]|nr:hypothetical protein [Longimicrobiaceae bacterium]